MSAQNQDAEAAYEQRYPPPDVLHSILAECGLEPDNLTQMIDMAAVGMTASWWRNTHVEDWHAGSKIGALSDIDMYRINTHTTAKIRERLRGWRRQHHITGIAAVAGQQPARAARGRPRQLPPAPPEVTHTRRPLRGSPSGSRLRRHPHAGCRANL